MGLGEGRREGRGREEERRQRDHWSGATRRPGREVGPLNNMVEEVKDVQEVEEVEVGGGGFARD